MFGIKNTGMDPDDFKKLRTEAANIHHEWFNDDIMIEIKISKRLKRNNGKAKYSYVNKIGEIKLSHKHYKKFGVDSLIYVLRHEYAHIINCYRNGRPKRPHDRKFKELCRELGGKMNKSLAGAEFADCAWENYIKKEKKFCLTCPECGGKIKRDRVSKKLLENYRCGYCQTPVKDFKIAKNIQRGIEKI